MILPLKPLREIALFDPPPSSDLLNIESFAAFAPMSSMSAKTGELTIHETRKASELLKGYTYFQNNDVLVAKITPCFENGKIGQARIVEHHAFGSTEFHVIRANEQYLNSRYLHHFLRSPNVRTAGERRMTGSAGQRRVPRAFLQDLHIPVPGFDEQHRIAEILDRIEVLRAKRQSALEKIDTLKQSVFARMSETNPTSKVTLHEVSLQINDCPHSTPVWTDVGVRCLRTSNLGFGEWIWDDERFVSESTYLERSSRGHLCEGDIVLSREGTVGIAAIVSRDMRACMGQRLVQVRPNPSKTTPEFLLNYLLGVLAPSRIKQHMVGSTAQHLNVKELRALTVTLPSLEQQHAFSKEIKLLDQEKCQHLNSLEKFNAMFSSLQHRAFRGEL